MKLSFLEKLTAAAMGMDKMPDIKGRSIFTLTDAKTGKRERIVSDNMVTSAIAKIFAMNYLGMGNMNSLLPIKNLMGGCFLFNQTLVESVDTIFPPNSTANNLVARCGQTPHASGDTRRGHPGAPEITDDHIKFTYDWLQEEGNGTINAVCLTHGLAGDIGLQPDGTASLLKNYTNATTGINAFAANTLQDVSISRNRALSMPVALDSDGNGISLYLTSTELEEITVSHSFIKAQLLESANTYPFDSTGYRELSSRTATLSRTFNQTYTLLAQDSTNYYVMERDSGSNTTLYVDVIAKADMSVTPLTLNISGATLARADVSYHGAGRYGGIVSDGNVYWVSGSDSKTFVRINMSNVSDIEELTSEMTANISFGQTAFELSAGLILGSNFLINGQRVYPVARRANVGSYNENSPYFFDMLASGNGGPALLRSGFANDNPTYYYATQGGILLLPYLATVNNLQTSVQKTISKTMRLEYVLTAV